MIRIFSDSTCDLSKELIERYDITILPLHILLGEEEFLDGVDITPDEIYKWSDEHKTTPKTSAVSIEDVMKAAGCKRCHCETSSQTGRGNPYPVLIGPLA